MASNRKAKLRSGFNVGGEQAEADPLLHEAFYASGQYEALATLDDPHCFIVGRTGSGKSAALQQLEQEKPEHVIRINPEDLSLPYITDLQAVKFLRALDVHLDALWIALWKHVLLVEILRRRYRVTSPATKLTFLTQIKELISRDAGKVAALDYLDEFEGRFWCEADERVKEITDKFAKRIEVAAAGTGEVPTVVKGGLSAIYAREQSEEVRAELAARFQRIVNETQLARLNMMVRVLDEDILKSAHDYIVVVIDDLDREWVDEGVVNDLIRCLFRTVLELKRVDNLKILVALRTNLLEELDFGKRSGQEEKFRALMMDMRWTRSELQGMLDERVRAAAQRYELQVTSLSQLLPQTNRTRGNPIDYILDRTLLRPRDAIAFVNECLSTGAGKARLAWTDVYSAERLYSKNRLLALRDEWKGTYPGIDQVVEQFRGARHRMTPDIFEAVMESVVLLPADPNFPGVIWITELSSAVWSGSANWSEMYQPLARLLYTVGLLGCSSSASAKPNFFVDDELLLDSEAGLARCTHFFVHRAYHAALDIQQ